MSDTANEIPDPNLNRDQLYQDVVLHPIKLRKPHFEEVLIYNMILAKDMQNPILVMIIETMADTFVYRTFFVLGSSRKTYVDDTDDKTAKYADALMCGI